MTNKPVEWVASSVIQKLFNDSQLYNKVVRGELIAVCRRHSHPTNPPPSEPVCTYSQLYIYYDLTGNPLAVVHQYLRPDGSIGASGLPDPKKLFFTDKIIAVRAGRK